MQKLIFISVLLFVVTAKAHNVSQLGLVIFPTSGNQKAQVHFINGIKLLHNFEYQDARKQFLQAEKLDRNFAMAYWGEAMTYNHPIWNEQDLKAGKTALMKLGKTPEARINKAIMPIEKEWIGAINLLYGEGKKALRDEKYLEAMRKLYRHYPNNDEAAVFYSLALLGATEGKRDFQSYMRAAGVAEDVNDHHKNHPGALHYSIHSYDDPIHAPLGLRAAREYAKAAPDAPHALHMPSHIFLALGMWDDVIASNKAAWTSAIKHNPKAIASAYTIDDLHALQWLMYGYLQKQDYAAAYSNVKKMQEINSASNTPMTRWYYSLMRSTYLTATQNWVADLPSFDMHHDEIAGRVNNTVTNALIILNHKTQNQASQIKQAKQLLAEITQGLSNEVVSTEPIENFFESISESGKQQAEIMRLELKAEIEKREGHINEAITTLHAAEKLEDQQAFGYGPPLPVIPSYELLGELLLQKNQSIEAYQVIMKSLKRMPNRQESLQYLQKAEKILKQQHIALPEKIQPYFNRLMKPAYFH